MYGLGHGGIESMLLVSGLLSITLIQVLALARADLSTLPLTAEQRALAQQQLAAIAAQPVWVPLLGAWESLWTIPLHVALSVVGTERLTESGSFRAKIAQEKLIRESAIPYTIVHATQFFEFVKSIAAAATEGNTVRLAPVLIQPMAAEDVASAVCRIAEGLPVKGIVEIAGPQQFRLDELIRHGLSAGNDPREVIADPHALYFGAMLQERTLVPGAGARLAETRFDDWLSQPVVSRPA